MVRWYDGTFQCFQGKTQVSKIKRVAEATLLKWAVSIKPYPTRDSTRIVKHTFDVAKIGFISESSKEFANYFQFLPFLAHMFGYMDLNDYLCINKLKTYKWQIRLNVRNCTRRYGR